MPDPTGYSVTSYGDMITSEPRMPAYDAALQAAIKPGCHVIDIGAGTGIFSLLACKYGAGHVTAIEPADGILLLKETARSNGFADRITILQDLSTNHVPARKADVIVSDIRGIMPLFEHHVATIVDARERLLAPGGTLIPQRDTIRGALASAPEQEERTAEPWLRNPYDLDLSAGYSFAVNTYRKVYLEPEAIVSDVQDIAILDYRSIVEPNLATTASFKPKANGVVHGLLLWFDAELADGIGFSNAPGEKRLIYGQSFLPFEAPQTLTVADHVETDVKANLVDGSYVWSWTTRVFRANAARPALTMRQSSFKARVISPDALARHAESYVPLPIPSHYLDARILSLVDGCKSLREIAEIVREEFPQMLTGSKTALDRVARLIGQYQKEIEK